MKYIIVDFSHKISIASVLQDIPTNSQIWLFFNDQEQMLTLELCEILCRFGQNVYFTHINYHDQNILSLYIAYYLGKIIDNDKDADITLLTSDNCFSNLMQHLIEKQHINRPIQLGHYIDITTESSNPNKAIHPSFTSESHIHPQESKEYPPLSSERLTKYLHITLTTLFHHGTIRPLMREKLEILLQRAMLDDEWINLSGQEKGEIIRTVVDTLIERNIIKIDPQTELITYHFSGKDIFHFLITQTREKKPATISEARAIYQQECFYLNINIDNKDIQDILSYCQLNKFIKIDGQNIFYPPFESLNYSA